MTNVECAMCGERETAGELLEHIHAKHIGPFRHNYSCQLCHFVSTDADALLVHANEKRHLPIQMKVTARGYVNDLAEKIMRDSLELTLKQGVKRKLEEERLESPVPLGPTKACKLCQQDISKTESSFLQHITYYHCNSPLKCPFCTKSRNSWNKLRNHVQKKHQSKVESFSVADMEDAPQLRGRIWECFRKKTPTSSKKMVQTPNKWEIPINVDEMSQKPEESLGEELRKYKCDV